MSAPLHLLQVSSSLRWSGAAQQCLALAAGCAKHGDSVRLACQPGSVLQRRARALGVKILPLRMRSAGDLAAVRSLRGVLTGHGVPLIHAHDPRARSLCALAAFDGSATRVATRREVGRARSSLGALRHRLGVDHWVAVSPRVADSLSSTGVARDALSVIPAGIELDGLPTHGSLARNDWLPEWGLVGHTGPLVGTAVDLSSHAGLSALVDAAGALRERWPDLVVLIAGDGEQRQFLQARVARLRLGDVVRLPGWIDGVDRLLALLDVYAAPARSQGYHLALLRALAIGCPVVAADVGDAGQYVTHEANGLLVPPGDAPALATAIARLLQHADWAAGLGRAGCRVVRERYSLGQMVHAHRRLYARLLAVSSSPQP